MAVGNPFLATWDVTGVVRMFEYTGGVFVQLGSVGGLAHVASGVSDGAMEFPFLAWMGDDTGCVFVASQNTSQAYAVMVSPIAATLDTELFPNGTNRGQFRASKFNRDAVIVNLNEWNTTASVFTVRADEAGALSQAQAATIPQYRIRLREHTPDGSLMLSRTAATTYLYSLSSAPDAQPLAFTLIGAAPFTIACDMAKWAGNNKGVVVVDVAAARAQVWRYEASQWELMQELPLPAGAPEAIAMSPDGRALAVSTLSGGVYATRIYRRIGDYFQPAQSDLSGVGALLDFSADGKLLVDSAKQSCFVMDASGVFIDNSAAMVNVPTAIAAQALSYGRVDPYGDAALYDVAPGLFADEAYDAGNLKLTLLTSAAAFDRTDSTPDFSAEVTTGGWPAGGVLLQNITSVSGPGVFSLSADPVERVIIESALTARYALIYDATNNKPLVFIDLINDRVVAKNRTLLIDFRDGIFLKFAT